MISISKRLFINKVYLVWLRLFKISIEVLSFEKEPGVRNITIVSFYSISDIVLIIFKSPLRVDEL